MSNKPKIYGTCPAGCLWETVHKDDFERSASIVKINGDLEVGKTYKFPANVVQNAWGGNVNVKFDYMYQEELSVASYNATYPIALPAYTPYTDFLKIKIHDLIYQQREDDVNWYDVFLVVSINDKISYQYTGVAFQKQVTEYPEYSLPYSYIRGEYTGFGACYLVNEDATVRARDGDTGAAIVSTILIGQDESGGNIYEQTFDNGATAQFVAPKGEQGEKGEVPIVQTTGNSPTAVMSQLATTESIDEITSAVAKYTYITFPLEQGTIHMTTGGNVASNARVRTGFLRLEAGYTIKSTFQILINKYDTETSAPLRVAADVSEFTLDESGLYRLVLNKADSSELTPEDVGFEDLVYYSKDDNLIEKVENNSKALVKTSDIQLFDKDNAIIFYGDCSSYQAKIFVAYAKHETICVPCESNTWYTVSIASGVYTRFSLTCSEVEPYQGLAFIENALMLDGKDTWQPSEQGDALKTDNGRDYVTFKTGATAKYICYYCYNADTDSDRQAIYDSVMVEKGKSPSAYEPYSRVANEHSVEYKSTLAVYLGDELIENNATFENGSGWSGDNANGYTFAWSGINGLLSYNITTEAGSVYLLEFDTTFSAGEFVKIGFGNNYRNLAYNGKTHIVMPLLSDGGALVFEPYMRVGFTITNISLKKIQDEGEQRNLWYNSVLDENHRQNYGFRNFLLGNGSAINAVGSTRTIAIGDHAMYHMKGGHRNIGIGGYVMSQFIGGEANVCIGADAMISAKGGDQNIAIGSATLAIGKSLVHNIAIGQSAINNGGANSTASENVAIGSYAGNVTNGKRNVFIGAMSGLKNTSGNFNVFIGDDSGRNNSNDIGSSNTGVGKSAGCEAGCSGTIALGADAKATKSNQMVLGSTNITEVVVCGNKKINFNADGTVTWETI